MADMAASMAWMMVEFLSKEDIVGGIEFMRKYRIRRNFDVPDNFPESFRRYLPNERFSYSLEDTKAWCDLFRLNWDK